MENKPKVLVFIKAGYPDIEKFIENNFIYQIYRGTGKTKLPALSYSFETKEVMLPKKGVDKDGRVFDTAFKFRPDWIISFLSPWRIPAGILECAGKGAINFHPGPPKYPGIGCYNYAIWNEDKGYAVTVHHMEEDIDSGQIIDVKWFHIYKNDTIETLKNRAIINLKWLFYDIMERILKGYEINRFEGYQYRWGEYKSRADFQEFCKIKPEDFLADWDCNFDVSEIKEKLQATYFKGAPDGPYIKVNNVKWRLIPEYDL